MLVPNIQVDRYLFGCDVGHGNVRAGGVGHGDVPDDMSIRQGGGMVMFGMT